MDHAVLVGNRVVDLQGGSTAQAGVLSGIEPRRLWLELTESSILEPRFSAVLHDVRELGVRTALDDFGNGYSSLTAMMSLPVQMVKSDRSFTGGIGEGTPRAEQSLEVIRGIVTLAGASGLPTVAEGVERAEQAALLTRAGCTFLQGTCSAARSRWHEDRCAGECMNSPCWRPHSAAGTVSVSEWR